MGYLSVSSIEKKIIHSVYNPNFLSNQKTNFNLFSNDKTYYYAYCRHALQNALKILEVKAEDTILLPGFICKDILSSIHSISAKPVFYTVNELFELNEKPENLPKAKAIIAVNFFGFPQNLDKFRKYCNINGAYLIEDNAHGFLSQDENNNYLGTRGDIGLFSIRKTLPIPNGAVLLINSNTINFSKKIDEELITVHMNSSFKFKNILRKFTSFIGIWHIIILLFFCRSIRKLKTGNIYPNSIPEDEYILPNENKVNYLLFSYLQHLSQKNEVNRRRDLYYFVEKILKNSPCTPVFPNLPENTSPYLFPFYSKKEDISAIRKTLSKYYLECFPWPDLPSHIENSCPNHYKNVWGVRFLW